MYTDPKFLAPFSTKFASAIKNFQTFFHLEQMPLDQLVLAIVYYGDNFIGRTCHNRSLPVGITEVLFQDMIEISNWLIANSWTYEKAPYFGMGSFIRSLVQPFLDQINSPTIVEPRFRQYSAHDTTVGPLLAAFKLLDLKNAEPPYASHIEFELWKKSGTMQYYISISYNNKPLTLNCGNTFCPFDGFLSSIQSVIGSANWAQQCQGGKTKRYEFDFESLI